MKKRRFNIDLKAQMEKQANEAQCRQSALQKRIERFGGQKRLLLETIRPIADEYAGETRTVIVETSRTGYSSEHYHLFKFFRANQETHHDQSGVARFLGIKTTVLYMVGGIHLHWSTDSNGIPGDINVKVERDLNYTKMPGRVISATNAEVEDRYSRWLEGANYTVQSCKLDLEQDQRLDGDWLVRSLEAMTEGIQWANVNFS
ncbi:MAG: hypothetical protein ABIJ10_07295 [Candidatus Micrarchaeota archaeon]|nr:hypothetical protein [Candidatus Micrarchaeota archaeon]MBU1886514.1 hypothetical protein [Candidatus Micrarchaeota archaeon]